jgi:hypothetical protein
MHAKVGKKNLKSQSSFESDGYEDEMFDSYWDSYDEYYYDDYDWRATR